MGIAAGASVLERLGDWLAAYGIRPRRLPGARTAPGWRSTSATSCLLPSSSSRSQTCCSSSAGSDRPAALVPVYATFLIPFCTWLLMGYLKSIPREIEEAAMVDGAGRLRVMLGIVLPLSGPGLISAFIFAFTLSGRVPLPLVFMSAPEHKTVPVGLDRACPGATIYQWGPAHGRSGAWLHPGRDDLLSLRRPVRRRE